MKQSDRRIGEASNARALGPRSSTSRLFWAYTGLFALFFVVFFSPFWVYGKALMWAKDGTCLHIPALTYSKYWVRNIVKGLLRGKLEIPFWALDTGFGQNTIGTNIGYRLSNLLFALFPDGAIEGYIVARTAVYLYLTGLAFIAYARTRVKDHTGLLMGSLLYVFSGFTLAFVVRHYFFVDLILTLPLMLIGVDAIFDGKWSWVFLLTVAWEGIHGFYLLFMITIPAVVYALFRLFELSPGEKARRGGFWGILLRHVVEYALGLGLCAISLVPALMNMFNSSRASAQQGVDLLHWRSNIYLNYVRSIMDMEDIGVSGVISLYGIGFIGIAYLVHTRRKRDRLVLGQLILYTVVFLVPALTMVFSAMAGRTQRWCFIFVFWASLGAACALPGLREDEGPSRRFCMNAFLAYSALYLAVTVWVDREVTVGILLSMACVALLLGTVLSDWGRRHRRWSTAALFALILVELAVKTFTWYSPQYHNAITTYIDAGKLLQEVSDNAADALDLARDDGLYRTDVVTLPRSAKAIQTNYGARSHVNGVSSFNSILDGVIVDYSVDLGNTQRENEFKIMDLDQRTVLDELAAVKYVAVLENGLDRVPYGYELVGSREKALSDGTVTTEYLYRNAYALPLSYAYDAWIPRAAYDALPMNRREQAMLQGVVLEAEVPLEQAELAFDDRVILDHEAIMDELRKAADRNEKLEVTEDGVLRVNARNCGVSIPIGEVEGEICLSIDNVDYTSVNYSRERAEQLAREGAPRVEVMNARRAARTWTPTESVSITVSSGALSDDVSLYGPGAQYYTGSKSYLLNLGYGTTEKKLTIIFSSAGEYRFERMTLIAQPMDGYADKVEPLRRRSAKSTGIDGNTVTVKYDLDESAFALLAVPYSRSWSATVDGEKAQILPANGMYMGVMLPAGEHTIVYRYALRGFREGAALSLATLIGLVVFGIVRRARRRRR